MRVPSSKAALHRTARSLPRLLILFLALSTSRPVSAGQITGRLLFDRSPVEGAEIAFRAPANPLSTWFGSALPGSNGTFDTSNDLATGTYESFTYRSSSLNPDYLAPHRTGLEVTWGEVLDIGDVALIQADRAITGTVGGSSGNIPDFITIVSTATIDGVDYVVRSTPDENRSFRLPAADGTWTIIASYFSTILGQAVVPVSGADVGNIQLGQPLPEGRITGRLVRPDGSPLPLGRFTVRPLDPSYFSLGDFTAMDSGTFNYALAPGRYELGTFSGSSGIPASNLVQYISEFTVVDGEILDLGDLLVLDTLFSVTGNVLDANGSPASFANLTAVAEIDGVPFRVWSWTSEGLFGLPLADASWRITADDFYGSFGEVTVDVAGEDVGGIDIDLTIDPSPYDEWAASYELFGEDAYSEADPDTDGYTNGQEFAFGTDPTQPTPALTTTTRVGNEVTISWLQIADVADLSYFIRQSSDLNRWVPAEGVVIVDSPLDSPAAPAGYVRKQFTVAASGKSFYRVLATTDPAAVPDESFTIKVSNTPVAVERWGSGPRALVFFGYIPFSMQEDLKSAYAGDFAQLVGEDYSMFLWTYPESASPFSDAIERYTEYNQNEASAWAAEKIDFSGVTTSVVSQIRAATGLVEVCVVANSFGAGVVLWDFAALSADPGVRFVLISPTELYMPAPAGLPPDSPLPRTLLAADPERDPFFNTPAARQYLTERANAALPPDYNPVLPSMTHLIIGQHPTSLPYVFSLIDSVYEQP